MTHAPTASYFCSIIGARHTDKLPGFWKGSAFRHHPRGIIRNRMIFTNEWNVNHYCSVKVITDTSAKIVMGCNAPASYGNPHPTVSSGDLVTVYRNGSFTSGGPWVVMIPKILEEVKAEILAEAEAEKAAHDARQESSRAEAQKRIEAARLALLAETAE